MIIAGNTTIITLSTGLDLTSYNTFKIGYRDPDNVKGEWTATVSGPADEGKISTTETLTDGTWYVWSIVDNLVGESVILEVYTTPPEEKQITDITTVKKVLGITSNNYDFMIENLIPVVEQDYEDIRNVPFHRPITYFGNQKIYGDKEYPAGSNIVAAEMIGYKIFSKSPEDGYRDVERESLGSYSVTFAIGGSYPKIIMNSIKRYARII